MPRKNPAAVALGRRKSAKKASSSARNGLLGGRPSVYKLTKAGIVEKHVAGHWTALHEPYDAAAKQWLRRVRAALDRRQR